jgi:hypothetical protein
MLGFIIIAISWLIQPVINYAQKHHEFNKHEYELLEWSTNGTLQLQRLAHEQLGSGTWSNFNETVPITGSGELLAALDTSDTSHPRLATGEYREFSQNKTGQSDPLLARANNQLHLETIYPKKGERSF